MKLFNTILLCVVISVCSTAQDNSRAENITKYIGGVYQKYISGIRGGSCPMYPSCSNYGLDVFKQEGVISGFLKTPDRLMRCGHEHSLYSYTYQQNRFKLLDPVNSDDYKHLVYTLSSRHFPINDTVPDIQHHLLIKELMVKEMYSEALIEIIRYKITNGSFNLEMAVNYLVCLEALNQHENAIFEYENSFSTHIKSDPNINFEMARIWNSLNT